MLDWATTGHRTRSGYDLAAVVRSTGLEGGGINRVIVISLLLLPLLAAIAIAAELCGLRGFAVVLLSGELAVAGIATWSVAGSPVQTEAGLLVTAACVIVIAVLTAALVVRRPGPIEA